MFLISLRVNKIMLRITLYAYSGGFFNDRFETYLLIHLIKQYGTVLQFENLLEKLSMELSIRMQGETKLTCNMSTSQGLKTYCL